MGLLVFQQSSGGTINVQGTNTASAFTWTIPASTDTFVGLAATQTLTNKTLTSPAINGATSGAITLAVPAVSGSNTATFPAATGTVMVSGNMPAFSAYSNTGQTITSSTWTKVALQAKEFDTNTNFDNTTNYRFTPTVAGYYQINGCIDPNGTAVTRNICSIYKNGTEYKRGVDSPTSMFQLPVSSIVYFNGTTDYVELYGYIAATSPSFFGSGTFSTYLNGSLIRSA